MYLSKKMLGGFLVAYMAIIFLLSHIPSGTDDEIDLIQFEWLSQELGNLLHIPLFAGLAYLWIKFLQSFLCEGYRLKMLVFIFSLLFAISDEAHQYFIPGRFASFSDIVLDLVGILLMLKFYPVIDYFFRIRIEQNKI